MKFVPVRVKENLLPIFLLLLIVTIFLCSRLYKLDSVPGSLYWDESSIGYNAYSILKTGTDEWGQSLPVHFRAFGEYKLPVYIYTVAFFESLIGLNAVAVRLPAVLFTLGTLVVLFLLVRNFFNDVRLGLIAAFLFVISPWLYIFSRTGYEVTAGLFFMLLGIYFFHLHNRNPVFFITSAASFLLSIYSYNSFRILLPFILFWFLIQLVVQKKFKLQKYLISAVLATVIFIIGCLPIISLYLSRDGLERFNEVGIYHVGDSRKEAIILFSKNYFSHFNPNFLFLAGDQNLRSHTGEAGELFWFSFPFIIMGILFCIKHHRTSHSFLLYLLIISPIPAALTKESPHALRAVFMFIPLIILTAIGIFVFSKKIRFKNHVLIATLVLFLFLFLIFESRFFNNYNIRASQSWQGEYKQAIDTYGDTFSRYDYVVISDRYAQPYIFYSFYRQIDPHFYHTNKLLNELPRSETSLVKRIGNVEFNDVILEKLPVGRLLLFAHPDEELVDQRPIATLWNPDKSVAFYVYEYTKGN